MISGLRLAGIGVGLALLFILSRNKQMRRSDFVLGRMVAFSLLGISLLPQIVAVPAFLLSLDGTHHTRIITVLLLAVTALGVVLMGQRSLGGKTAIRLHQLVDDLALEDFRREYGEVSLGPVAVIIPAYHEAENIGQVLKEIPREVLGQPVSVLVVVDGSRDGTREVASRQGAYVCQARVNRGGGAALRLGYQVAVQRGVRYVVTLDADGQHVPSEMAGLLEPLLAGEADFVQGSRRLGVYHQDDAVRLMGVYLYGWLISFLTGQKITDSSNGFRAMRSDVVEHLSLREDQFYSSEMLIGAIRKGYRVLERPVTVRRRHSGSSKKGKNLVYGYHYMTVILRSWLREM